MKKEENTKETGVSQQDETVMCECVNILKGILTRFMIENEYDWDRLSTSRYFLNLGNQSVLEVQLVERMLSEDLEFIRFDLLVHDLSTNEEQQVISWVKDRDSIRYLGFQSLTVDHPLSDEEVEQLTESNHDIMDKILDEMNERKFRNN